LRVGPPSRADVARRVPPGDAELPPGRGRFQGRVLVLVPPAADVRTAGGVFPLFWPVTGVGPFPHRPRGPVVGSAPPASAPVYPFPCPGNRLYVAPAPRIPLRSRPTRRSWRVPLYRKEKFARAPRPRFAGSPWSCPANWAGVPARKTAGPGRLGVRRGHTFESLANARNVLAERLLSRGLGSRARVPWRFLGRSQSRATSPPAPSAWQPAVGRFAFSIASTCPRGPPRHVRTAKYWAPPCGPRVRRDRCVRRLSSAAGSAAARPTQRKEPASGALPACGRTPPKPAPSGRFASRRITALTSSLRSGSTHSAACPRTDKKKSTFENPSGLAETIRPDPGRVVRSRDGSVPLRGGNTHPRTGDGLTATTGLSWRRSRYGGGPRRNRGEVQPAFWSRDGGLSSVRELPPDSPNQP